MKITVITDERGDVIGTARFPSEKAKGQPVFRPLPKPNQKVREIELPGHLEKLESADDLHRELKKHIGK